MTLSNIDAANSSLVCVEVGESVADAIESIETARPELTLDPHSDLLNLLDARVSDFLETRFARIQIPSPVEQPLEAVAIVFASPEVRERMNSLGLEDLSLPRPAQLQNGNSTESLKR
jgi:hypothetical protein